MKEVTPGYYHEFRCIADKCKHNCCIGWEIDIDEEKMKFYNSLDTKLGQRIRSNVEGEQPHFVLAQGDRCPFLNDKNLCDIISELGENGLCEICHLHPRFRNFYSDFCETGLGLCCEEAARLILTQQEKVVIEIPTDVKLSDEEREFFEIRNMVFYLLQDRNKSIYSRFSELSEKFGLKFSFSLDAVCDILLGLERLDEKWTEELLSLKDFQFDEAVFESADFSVYLENLAVYFVFRHFTNALEFADYSDCVKFALLSTYVIAAVWVKNNCTSPEELAESARMYSSEIEYSEENTYALLGL